VKPISLSSKFFYARVIKERPHISAKRPTHPVPNFIHLQADKIPGYEKFKLDEYIRDKHDVIHYVDSPVIEPKKISPGKNLNKEIKSKNK